MGRLKHIVIRFLIKNLLQAVTLEDVVRTSPRGTHFIGKRRLSPEEVSQLRDEARSLSDSFVWGLISKEVALHAKDEITLNAQSIEKLIFGRALIYNLDLIQRIIEKLKSL